MAASDPFENDAGTGGDSLGATPDLPSQMGESADNGILLGVRGGAGRKLTPKYDAESAVKQDNLEAQWEAWSKTKDPAAFRDVMRQADPVINSAVTSYAPNSSPAVRSRAKVLARRALESYDPSKGAKLKTHIMNQLQPLRREAYAYNTLHTPERIRLDLSTLNKANNAFVEERGREPSDQELADYTGLSQKRINHIRKYDKSPVIESKLLPEDEDDVKGLPAVMEEADMWEEFVYHGLSPRDQLIYDLRTGKGGTQRPLGVSEIAKKLKVSPSAVTQRLAKISEEIRQGPGD